MPDTSSAAYHRETSEKIALLKHAPPEGFLRKYVFSLDHKVIGKQYLDLALASVVTGMVLSWLMRFHLGFPMRPSRGSASWRLTRQRAES